MDAPHIKFSINLSHDVGTKLRELSFEENVSQSAIVEIAIQEFLRRIPPKKRGAFLREHGACLRRGR